MGSEFLKFQPKAEYWTRQILFRSVTSLVLLHIQNASSGENSVIMSLRH